MAKTLFDSIAEDIRLNDLQQKDIAKKINVTEASLTYYLKNTNNMKFIQFIELINVVYGNKREKKRELIKKFINTDSKKSNLLETIEWCSLNGELELFNICLEKLKEIKELTTYNIYLLIYKRNQNMISPAELFNQVEILKLAGVKRVEQTFLLNIVTLYTKLDYKEYRSIQQLSDFYINQLSLIKNKYIQTSFRNRFIELKAIALLKTLKYEECEKLCQETILENDYMFPMVNISLKMLLSERYVFDNYEKSIKYIREALSDFYKLKLENMKKRECELKDTSDFINIYNGNYEELFLISKAEKLHYFARTKNLISGYKLLEEMEKEKMTPHQLYYKALLTGSKSDMLLAKDEFYKNGDLFYVKLTEIKKKGNIKQTHCAL